MERRTKHRILGIIVVVAIVFLLLPFMQRSKDVASDTTMVSAPPFPEQKDTETIAPDDTISVEGQPKPIIDESLTPEASTPVADDKADHRTINEKKTVEPEESTEKSTEKSDEQSASSDLVDEAVNEAIREKNTKKTERPTNDNVIPVTSSDNDHEDEQKHDVITLKKPKTPVITDNGLFDIKTQVWVVQVGTFNSKQKAMQLVNQLRSHRYSAFLQQIRTASGMSHLVFVGPELANQSARELADDIEKEHHLRGMVVSYKPMTLT